MNLKQQILNELAKGDRFPCQLYDALNLRNYREMWRAIEQLKVEGKIKSYFSSTPPTATLTYTLAEPKQTLVSWISNAASRTNQTATET